jgi:nitrogen fixation-related uncharacterized protein
MEAIVMLIVLVVGVASLDISAFRWGADSRDQMPDDHQR